MRKSPALINSPQHTCDLKSRGEHASAGRKVVLALLDHITALSAQVTALEKDLQVLVTALAPELGVCGISVITAARILGETGDIRRFRSQAAYARHNGIAPVPVSSGSKDTWRLNRSGNWLLNAAIHRAAITQDRCHPGARALLDRRARDIRETPKAAIRALKRHLSDVIYRAPWPVPQIRRQVGSAEAISGTVTPTTR